MAIGEDRLSSPQAGRRRLVHKLELLIECQAGNLRECQLVNFRLIGDLGKAPFGDWRLALLLGCRADARLRPRFDTYDTEDEQHDSRKLFHFNRITARCQAGVLTALLATDKKPESPSKELGHTPLSQQAIDCRTQSDAGWHPCVHACRSQGRASSGMDHLRVSTLCARADLLLACAQWTPDTVGVPESAGHSGLRGPHLP